MAWDYTLSSEIKVDILVGLDSYWKFVKPQITGCSVEGLMAQSTVFGWVLFGSVPVSQITAPVMSHPMLCLTISEQSVKSFWELESIGISPDKEDSVKIWEWLEAGGGALWSHPPMEVGSQGAAPWQREIG